MQQPKEIAREIAITNLIKTLAETYEEAATREMKKTRDGVLTKRDFMLRILEIYVQVKQSYKNEIEALKEGKYKLLKKLAGKSAKQGNSFLVISKKKDTAAVLLTSNRSMVGPVNLRVFDEFYNHIISNKNIDLIIIGRVGKNFMESRMPGRKYTYFDLPTNLQDMTMVTEITKVLVDYRNIEVFHGKYLNLVNQVGVKTPLTGNIEQIDTTQSSVKKIDYLFEPSLKEVLKFFETQIFNSLFTQTLSETNLANLGSRIQSMEQTVVGTEEYLKKLNAQKLKARKYLEEKKQKQRIIASLIISNGH